MEYVNECAKPLMLEAYIVLRMPILRVNQSNPTLGLHVGQFARADEVATTTTHTFLY